MLLFFFQDSGSVTACGPDQAAYSQGMAGLTQTQSLSQQQVLAPQLQQSLQILQAPMLELRNLVQQEIETNPTLEMDATEPSLEDRQREMDDFKEEFDRLAKLDEEWRDYMSQNSGYSGRSSEDEERRQFFFDSLVKEETLQQHLLEQISGSELAEFEVPIAELLIGNLDDHGFLQSSLEEISSSSGLDTPDLERVLEVVQSFHPVLPKRRTGAGPACGINIPKRQKVEVKIPRRRG